MLRWIVIVSFLAAVLIPCSGASAAWLHENELANPCFEQSGAEWDPNGNMAFNAGTGELKFDRPHIAYDPPGVGESGYIRQIVDNSQFSGWNPNLNHKIGYLTFWVYTTGPAYVQVGFDWWDRTTDPKPVGYNEPGYHTEILPMQFTSLEQWTPVDIVFDWAGKPGNNQPRWVSLEFYFWGCSQTGFEAAVDDVYFTSQCVPEPSCLVALSGSLAGLAGLALRARRR